MWERSASCIRLLTLGAVITIGLGLPVPYDPVPACGYQSCPTPKPGMINVHLVPHSHDDVGWLKTVDQYYWGSNTRHQRAGVQYILDSVVDVLSRDPTKRFIQVETSFFAQWWGEQDESQRNLVKKLVANGQLEFIGGAWSMNDEALANYQVTIDQFTLGYRFLNDTFGACAHPKIAWQIDPFGHSRGFGTMIAQMGLDGIFQGRIDWEDKENRLKKKTPEMIWKTSPNLGGEANLFTGILYNLYDAPPGFCFDDLCDDDPIIDDKKSIGYNKDAKITDFIKLVEQQAAFYSDNILLTMGSDFQYQNAGKNYKNMDKLIRYVNERQTNGSKIHAFYSTPSCYVKALHDANKTWTTKDDDFFPYGSAPNDFFTGYFSSRPTHKYLDRVGNNLLQVSKQLYSFASFPSNDLEDLKEAMGVLQHHDAITGTEKQHVADDYARIVSKGLVTTANAAEKALKTIMEKNATESPKVTPEFKSCLTLNVSHCEIINKVTRFVVTVYNPLDVKEGTYVRVPVQKGTYTVQDPQGREQKVQIVPLLESVLQLPGRTSTATHDLVFYAEELPPLGLRSYYIARVSGNLPPNDRSWEPVNSFKIGKIGGVSAEIDSNTGLLKGFTNKHNVTVEVQQDFTAYHTKSSSGAYMFKPKGPAVPITEKASIKVYKGELVEEVHQTFTDWLSQVIRIYPKEDYVELNWQVGPVPVSDGVSKEIITRFQTHFNTKQLFYTDTNGREMIERKRDFRPSWDVHLKEKISGNYYPVTSAISIRDADKKQRLGVLVDRAQGASSLEDGKVELMIHRRLTYVEGLLGGALNETEFGKGLVVRGSHYLVGGDESPEGAPTVAAQERLLARRLLLKPWLFFSRADNIDFNQWQMLHRMEFPGLATPLPPNIHLMTLEPWKEDSLLVRLEHLFEKNDDPKLSETTHVILEDALKPFNAVSVRETTLAADRWLNESTRLQWKTNEAVAENQVQSTENQQESDIEIRPMQIRTFVVNIQK